MAETMIDPYKKICLYEACRKTFTARRQNQDYCSPDCKKKKNNGKAAIIRQVISPINWQLKRNREILEWFYEQKKFEVSWSDLQANGFDHTKHTGLTSKDKGPYNIPVFYDYSLEQLSNKNFKIAKL